MLQALAFVKILILMVSGSVWLITPTMVVPLYAMLLILTLGVLSLRLGPQELIKSLWRDIRQIKWPYLLLIASLTLWPLATLLWHPYPTEGLEKFQKIVLLIALLSFWLWSWHYTGFALKRWGYFIAAGLLLSAQTLALALFWQDIQFTSLIHYNHGQIINLWNKGTAMLSLWLWLGWMCLAQRNQFNLGWLLVIPISVLILQTQSLGAQIGLLCGLITMIITHYGPRFTPKALWLGLAVLLIGLPLWLWLTIYFAKPILIDLLPNSAIHRLYIWEYVIGLIQQQPLWGYGLHASRYLGETILMPSGSIWETIPLHPHNMPLQWWLELGFIGTTLIAGSFLWWLKPNQKTQNIAKEKTALWWAYWGNLTILGLVSYGSFQTWWVAALIITTAALTKAYHQR